MSTAWPYWGWYIRVLIGFSFSSCSFGASWIARSGQDTAHPERGKLSCGTQKHGFAVRVCGMRLQCVNTILYFIAIPGLWAWSLGDSGILITHSWCGQTVLMNNKHPWLWTIRLWVSGLFLRPRGVCVNFLLLGGKLCVWLSFKLWGQRNAVSVWVSWLKVVNVSRDWHLH